MFWMYLLNEDLRHPGYDSMLLGQLFSSFQGLLGLLDQECEGSVIV